MCIATAASRFSSFLLNANVNRQNRFTNIRVVQLNRSLWLVHIVIRRGGEMEPAIYYFGNMFLRLHFHCRLRVAARSALEF